MQIDDYARTLQNLPNAHTEQPFTPQPHPAAPHTPSPSPHAEQLQLLTQILASMQHQLSSSAPAQPSPQPHPPHDAPLSVAHPLAAVDFAPPPPQPTLLPPQQPPLLPAAVDFAPPP
ncbi:unnamed protein product, partial [Pylaiella littoralis]